MKRKRIVIFLLATLLLVDVKAQVDYSAPGVEINKTPDNHIEGREFVQYTDAEYIYTGGYSSVSKYDKESLSNIWRSKVTIDNINGEKVIDIETLHRGDATTHILYRTYDKKKKQAKFYHSSIDENGTKNAPVFLTSLVVANKNDCMTKVIEEKGELILVAFTGQNSNSLDKIHAIWINREWDVEHHLTTGEPAAYRFESMDYDFKQQILYITTRSGFVSVNGKLRLPSFRYLIAFEPRTESVVLREIDMKEYDFSGCSVNIDSISSKIHLIGLVGPKKTSSISGIIDITFEPGLPFKVEDKRIYPIQQDAVSTIAAITTGSDVNAALNAALNFNNILFVNENLYYIVVECSYGGLNEPISYIHNHIGQLVVIVNEDQYFMTYLQGKGRDVSSSFVDDKDNLFVYSINKSKAFAETLDSKILETSTNNSFCLVEFKVTPGNKSSSKVLGSVSSNKNLSTQTLDNIGLDKKPSEHYITAYNKGTTLFQFILID